MMRKLLLSSFLIMLCLSGINIAEIPEDTAYYPRDNLLISLPTEEIPSDGENLLIEEPIDIRTQTAKTQHSIVALYNRLIGHPSVLITETISIIFILLGVGGLTLLLTRWKLPENPNSRPRVLLNTIREHPGATQSELQKLTGHSRGSVSVNLHHLSMTSKIRKSVQNGKTRYYLACTPDDEMKGFLRKLTTQENPQKILEAIISNPGISQKELHETTGIPRQHSSGISHSLQSMRPSKVRGNETPSTTASSRTLYSSTTTFSKKPNRTTHLQRKKNQTTKNHNHISFFQNSPFTETLIYANEQHNSTRESHS